MCLNMRANILIDNLLIDEEMAALALNVGTHIMTT